MKEIGKVNVEKFVKKRFRGVREDDFIENVVAVMKKEKTDVLPVIRNGEFVGEVEKADFIKLIIDPKGLSEEDIIKLGIGFDLGFEKKTVKQVMRSHSVSVTPKTKVKEAAYLMVKNGISVIPVMANKKLVGMVYRRDIINEAVK